MESLVLYKFVESALNLTLKNGTKFISAFAGQIVFGTCNAEGYKNYKYFEISVFELHSFYLAIAEIIKNLSTDSELNKTMLCKKRI